MLVYGIQMQTVNVLGTVIVTAHCVFTHCLVFFNVSRLVLLIYPYLKNVIFHMSL